MTSTPEPAHLSNHHRDTLAQSHDGKFVVTLGSETRTLERPRNKDIDASEVVELRNMLTNAGYGADPEQ